MVEEPKTPEKTGFEFDGWYTDSELTAAYDFTTEVTSDFTLYAKWKIIVLDVTFFTDGGSEIETQKINYNEKAAKPAKDPTKDHCTFDGWYTDKTFTTAFDFTTSITQNLTIYAKWLVNEDSFEVKFETSGGTDIGSQVLKEKGNATKPTVDPTREHSKFDGWYVDEGCSVAFDFNTELTEATTIYAKWIPVYTVTFNTNGGTTVTAQEVEGGKKTTKPTTDPTRKKYKFLGWYADENCTEGQEYNFNNSVYSNLTIYAKWIPLYTVTFIGADIPPKTLEKGQTIAKPETPTRSDGALFDDWYIDEEYSAKYVFGSEIVADIKIYAKWLDSWTVTFSGASSIEPVSVKHNQTVTKPADPADTETLAFDGWYADSTFKKPFDFNTKITANTTIYAKWLPFYTITFNSVDGSKVNPIKVVQGKKATKPTDPTRGSRTFAGWYKDSTYTQAFDFTAETITRDITLYAKWNMPEGVDNAITMKVKKSQLDVTYDSNTNGLMMQCEYTFTCNDGPADWYLNNKLVKSNSSEYMYTRTYFQQTGIFTVEARKVINDIVYTWTAVCSM